MNRSVTALARPATADLIEVTGPARLPRRPRRTPRIPPLCADMTALSPSRVAHGSCPGKFQQVSVAPGYSASSLYAQLHGTKKRTSLCCRVGRGAGLGHRVAG